jgi:hypothetical protein
MRHIDAGWTREILKMAEIGFKTGKMGASLESHAVERFPMGTDCSSSARPRRAILTGRERTTVCLSKQFCGLCAVARSAQELRQVVLGVETLPAMGGQGRVRAYFRMAFRELPRAAQGVPPIATRYDKTDTSFAAAIYLVGSLLALR